MELGSNLASLILETVPGAQGLFAGPRVRYGIAVALL